MVFSSAESERDLDKLQPVKIHFRTQEEDEKGLFALMVSGMAIHTFPNNNYVVNSLQIKILDEKGIEYDKIE